MHKVLIIKTKNFSPLLLIILLTTSLSAREACFSYADSLKNTPISSYQDTDLDLILKEARARQNEIKDFSADFEYSLSFPRERRSTAHGYMIYQRGRYVVKLPEQDVFCDGNARWYYIKSMKEVIIRDYEQEIGITMPFQIFNKGKSPRYSGKERLDDVMCDVIFFEEMPESAYESAKVWIDANSRIIQKIVLLFENQGTYTFHFRNIKINKGYSSTTFRFPLKNYPGVNVVDERTDR